MLRGTLHEAMYIATSHGRQDPVGLVALLSRVVKLHDVGVVAQADHGLRLTQDALATGLVQPFASPTDAPSVAAALGAVNWLAEGLRSRMVPVSSGAGAHEPRASQAASRSPRPTGLDRRLLNPPIVFSLPGPALDF